MHSFNLVTMSSKRSRSADAGPRADARDLVMTPAASSMQGSQGQADEGLEQQPESSSSHDRTQTHGRSTDAAPQEQGSADENQWLYKVVVT